MSGFSLFLKTADQLFQTGIMPLVTEGVIEVNQFMPLFAHREVYDIDNLPSGMLLYCHEPDCRVDSDGLTWCGDDNSLSLYTMRTSGVLDEVSLFTKGKAPLQEEPFLPMFLQKSGNSEAESLSLFITNDGTQFKRSGMSLFTFSVDFENVGAVDSITASSPMFIEGKIIPTTMDVSMPLVLQGLMMLKKTLQLVEVCPCL